MSEGHGGGKLRIRYEDPLGWGEFVVAGAGTTVDVYRSASVDLRLVFEVLLTQILSCAMSERGLTCLHAGVVRIAGRVALIVGPRGSGKSTTTAAVARRRRPEVLCDDVAALEPGATGITVLPGRSQVRLRPDAALVLARSSPLTPVWRDGDPDGITKHRLEFERAAIEAPVDVDAVYVLTRRREGPAAAPIVAALDPIEALAMLMANRHLAAVGTRAGRRRDFALLGDLVRGVPVRALQRGDDLTTLDAAVDALIADVTSSIG